MTFINIDNDTSGHSSMLTQSNGQGTHFHLIKLENWYLRYWQNSGTLMIKCHYSVRQWYCSQVAMSDPTSSSAFIGWLCPIVAPDWLRPWAQRPRPEASLRVSAVISLWLKRKITLEILTCLTEIQKLRSRIFKPKSKTQKSHFMSYNCSCTTMKVALHFSTGDWCKTNSHFSFLLVSASHQ